MKNRGILVVLLLVVALVVAGVLWALSDSGGGDGAGDGSSVPARTQGAGDAATPADDVSAETPEGPATTRRRRHARTWMHTGDGSLVGTLREYGTDRPVGGVKVALVAGEEGPNREFVTQAADDGSFVFEKVPAFDDWQLMVDAEAPLRGVQMSGVVVSAFQQSDTGVVYLSVGFGLSGVVVDTNGAPLADGLVRAVRSRAPGAATDLLRMIRDIPSDANAVDSADTDAKGRFTLTNVPPGTYDMFVSAPKHQLRITRGLIVTPESAERDLRFVLPEGFSLSGRVVLESGGQVEGIQVVAFPQPNGPEMFMTLDQKVFATADAQGKFTVEGLQAGEYVLAATPENSPTTLADNVKVPGTDFVEIKISGDAWLEGRVTEPGGKPVPQAEVFLVIEAQGAPLFATTYTDDQGRYRLDGLPVKKVQAFIVRAEGYAGYPSDATAMFRNRGPDKLEIKSGRNEKSIELVPGGTVRGVVVTGEKSEPLAGAKVQLISPMSMFLGTRSATSDANGQFELTGVGKGTALLQVSRDGFVQVDDPLADQAAMGRAFGGMMGRGGEPAPDTGSGPQISITEAGQVVERTIVMEAGVSISGRVLDPEGKPVAGAQVRFGAGDGSDPMMAMAGAFLRRAEPRLTGADGGFELPGARAGQASVVEVKADGFLLANSEPVTVAAGTTPKPIEIKLRRAATLEGRVTSKDGKPISGVEISWQEKDDAQGDRELRRMVRGAQATPAYTDATGHYSLADVGVGEIKVAFTHSQFVDLDDQPVTTAEGKVATLDVQLDQGLIVSGAVIGPDDRPVAGARVWLRSNEMSVWENAKSDEAGKFSFAGLKEGTYLVNGSSEGLTNSSSEVSAKAGGPPVTLRMAKALKIEGTVRFADGRPVVGAQVSASSEKGGSGAQTDGTGAFEMDGLTAGTYSLEVNSGWGDPSERPNLVSKTVPGIAAGATGVLIEVMPGFTIEGTVSNPDGTPADNGWVSGNAIGPNGEYDATRTGRVQGTVSAGKLLVTGLQAGRYRLNVRVGAQNRTVEAEAGDTGVRIELVETGGVGGHVARADGAKLEQCNVSVSGPNGSAWAMVDKDGKFEAAGLPAGRYTVRAQSSIDGKQWSGEQDDVDVTANVTTEGVEIVLREQQ